MQFSCESCKAQLQIGDEKVKGKRLIVRCRRCGAKIVIADPSLSKAPPRLVQPPAPAAPAPMRVAPLPQALAGPAGPARRESEVEDTRAVESEALVKAPQASKAGEPIENGAPSQNVASSLTGAPSQSAAPSRPPPPPDAPPADAPVWFAMLHGKQTGPLTRAEVVGKTDEGEIGPRTYLWKEGMSAWQRAKDVPELAGLFPQPPGPSLPPPLPIASSAPPPPPRPKAAPRKTSSLAPDLRKPVPSGALAGEAPGSKAKEDRFPIDANLSQAARPQDGPARIDAAQKKAAELARWATEELARMPSAPERPPQAPRPSMFESAAPERKNGAFLVFVVLAILAAAALALWLGYSDREKKPPPQSEKSETAPPPSDPPATPAAQARAEAPPPESPPREAKPAAGLTPAQVRRKLDESRGALQVCIDDALRREPNLRVGRIHIATTIAPSGQVTSARIDKRAVDESALGACLKRATRRIAFPQFGGDAFAVDIPIVVTAGE